MDWSMWRLLLISSIVVTVVSGCDESWLELGDSCYYLSNLESRDTLLTWNQARSWCLENGADLATIDNLEDRQLITNMTENDSYLKLWIGLNRLADRSTYRWVDGSTSEFRDWGYNEPNSQATGMCAYQPTKVIHNTFSRSLGINTIDGLFTCPSCQDRPRTFYFGYFPGTDDQVSATTCESKCMEVTECDSYTYISNTFPIMLWKGECLGRSSQPDVGVEDPYAISGKRIVGETGTWFVSNCGERQGFICRKRQDAVAPTAPPPTPSVGGFCPGEYFEAGGNKCFRIVSGSAQQGFTWTTALQLCRSGPGIAPDLASFQTEFENALITMHMVEHTWGYWTGLKMSDNNVNQWVWSDNQDFGYSNWAPSRPSGNGKCVELWTNPGPTGTWNNQDCTSQRGYVCQTYKDSAATIITPPSTIAHTCKAGYTNYVGSCYKKLASKMSWSAADTVCKNDGASLASVHSESENAAMMVFGVADSPFWIGYHENADGEWVWSDGWPALYDNFDRDEDPGTGGGCTLFKENGKWKDEDCAKIMNAVCKISGESIPTSPAFVEGVCPTGWVEYGSYCYYFSSSTYPESSSSWETAGAHCEIKAGLFHKGSLASIHNKQENEFIHEHIKSGSNKDSWIGLYKDEDMKHEWTDGTEFQFVRWAPGEPNDVNRTQRCVQTYASLWPGGLWNDHLCDQGFGFVCKAEKVPELTFPTLPPGKSCPVEWKPIGMYCYLVNATQVSFEDAQESCVVHGGRYASLALIPDAYTNVLLMMLLNEGPTGIMVRYWIGLARRNENSVFKWLDGSLLNFSYWAPGEPNNQGDEHCGEIQSSDGRWNDMNCETNRRSFICQIKIDDLPVVQTTEDPSKKSKSSFGGYFVSHGGMAGILIGTMICTVALPAIALIIIMIIRDPSRLSSAMNSIRKIPKASTAAKSGVENPSFQ